MSAPVRGGNDVGVQRRTARGGEVRSGVWSAEQHVIDRRQQHRDSPRSGTITATDIGFDASAWAAMLAQDGDGSTLDADTVDGLTCRRTAAWADGSQPGATSAAQVFDNGIEADTVAEATVDAGVTVDGVLLKDTAVTADQFCGHDAGHVDV